MLQSLTVENFILTEKLTLEFGLGLTVLTGETGAGKSILLDALNFVLGGTKSGRVQLKDPTKQAFVFAQFIPLPPAVDYLSTIGIEASDQLILRRQLDQKNTSKAYVNDMPVSVNVLKGLAPFLIDIHGQFEKTLDSQGLKSLLTERAGLQILANDLSDLYQQKRAAKLEVEGLTLDSKTRADDLTYLDHVITELKKAAPQAGEIEQLETKRQTLKSLEKLMGIMQEAQDHFLTIHEHTRALTKLLPRHDILSPLPEYFMTQFDQTMDQLARLDDQYRDLVEQVTLHESLDDIEGRLFQLKTLARKYQVEEGSLHLLLETLIEKQASLQNADNRLVVAEANFMALKTDYARKAKDLAALRLLAGQALAQQILDVLPPLKLNHVRLEVRHTMLPEEEGGAQGLDQLTFWVSFNKDMPLAPLNATASGGELSRFMLALKSVTTYDVPTLIFDEVDSGMGGAVADAVGRCLKNLAGRAQVVAITHAPQVAAFADNHWLLSKQSGHTMAIHLDSNALRAEELARMLAGAVVTDDARAAAQTLLKGGARS